MTVEEAKRIVFEYRYYKTLDEEEEFEYTEALKFLIEETKQTTWMVELGGHYYEEKDFDLALKYYEMADSYGDKWAPDGLGYIWYYGRTGEVDYEKAFKYYTKAAGFGNLEARIKLGDMYKNGYFVEKDPDKYREIVEDIYDSTNRCYDAPGVLPQVYTRLAGIRKQEGKPEKAADLLWAARRQVEQKLKASDFFGDLTVMDWLINDLYELTELDRSDFSLYDLFYILKEPAKVAFMYDESQYIVESVKEDDGIAVHFEGCGVDGAREGGVIIDVLEGKPMKGTKSVRNDKWYRSIKDFFKKAKIDDDRLTLIADQMYDFKFMDNQSMFTKDL